MSETASSSSTVLLILNNKEDIQTLAAAFTSAGFKAFAAPSAKEAFVSLFKSPPDLIVLDINLPDLDGFHFARELKRNMMLRHIPILVLSSRVDFLEKLRSFDVIVDEYLVRPFDIKDLLLRATLVTQRLQANLDASPLTRLPGNAAIVRHIKSKLGKNQPYAVGYADLNNFKAFNDKYGFSKGDEVITLAARCLVGAVQKLSPKDNFVGHIGGDDFIFVCDYNAANEVCQTIIEAFDREVPALYSDEDRAKGFIVVEDRRGVVSQFPLVSVAIGLVSDEGNKFSNLGQINHSLTQLKKYAKSFQGSAFVRDRRTLTNQLAEFTWGPGSAAGSSKVLENITSALGTYLPKQLDDVLKNKTVGILFQPILDMKDDVVYGHESLVRGPAGTPLEFPDALFQTARTANKVPELDLLCMQQALSAAGDFQRGMTLFINIFPETLQHDDMLSEILNNPIVQKLRLVFELSGSQRVGDTAMLFGALKRLRDRGQRICVDAAAVLTPQGFETLPALCPQYIKLNMMLYRDIGKDARKREEFIQTVNLVRQVGAQVICTKLESSADAQVAIRMGVNLGQGFLFAVPSKPKPQRQAAV